jgi:DHA2 family multidrug resistance protein
MTALPGSADAGLPGATGAGVPLHAWHSPYNPWLTAVVATLATFMEVLDTSIANVALPHIAGSLGAGVEDSTWVLTSYLVSNAIVLPTSAWISSLIGRKNFYMLCVAVFTISSLLCGLAQSLGMLVVFRLVQGIGGGGLQPSTQAILVDTFPPRQRGMGMAVYGMTVVVAPVIGPTLGGWITDNFSWRWIFFINIPVGIMSLLLSSRIISDPPYLLRRRGAQRFQIDVLGLALLSLGFGALQIMLDLGERKDWFASPWIRMWGIIAAVSLVWVAIHEWRHKDPIIDLRLLKDRNFGFSVLLMLIFGFILFGSTVLLPLLTQTLLGYTAMLSGLVLSPGALVIMVMMPLIGFLVTRIDPRLMIGFGVIMVAYSLYMMAQFNLQVDFWTVVIARMIQGFGLAFIFVPVNTVAYAFIAPQARNQASSLISLARNIGASVGIALLATTLARQTQTHRALLVGNISSYEPAFQQRIEPLTAAMQMQTGDPVNASLRAHAVLNQMLDFQARMLAFLDAFRWLAICFLILLPLVVFMKRPPHVHAEMAVD